MLASFPASMVNQKSTDLGIPNRFSLNSSRFSWQLTQRLQYHVTLQHHQPGGAHDDALDARIRLWLEHRTDEGRDVALRGVERGREVVSHGTPTRSPSPSVASAITAHKAACVYCPPFSRTPGT